MNANRWDIPRLPKEEGDSRYVRVREAMARQGLDCLIVAGHTGNYGDRSGNFRYLANYAPWFDDEYIFFPAQGGPTLLTFLPGHADWARRVSWIENIEVPLEHWSVSKQRRSGKEGYIVRLAGLVKEHALDRGRVGICDYQTMPAYVYAGLKDELPQAELVDVGVMMALLRAPKSDVEMQFMERAAHIADIGFQSMFEEAHPGVSERDVWAACEAAMTRAGAEAPSFTLMSSSCDLVSKGIGMPYGGTDRVMEAGDILLNEITPSYAGYWAQLVAPIVLGKPSDQLQRVFDLHAKIYWDTLAKLKPDVTMGEIQENARRIAWDNGSDRTSAWILQPIGLLVIEPLPPDTVLQANMTFMAHPCTRHGGGTYGGHYMGNTVAVTPEGGRSLSKTPIQIFSSGGN